MLIPPAPRGGRLMGPDSRVVLDGHWRTGSAITTIDHGGHPARVARGVRSFLAHPAPA